MKDVLGRATTPVETRLLVAYQQVLDLLRSEGLAPSTAANLKEAAAALWVAANELALVVDRPDEVGL